MLHYGSTFFQRNLYINNVDLLINEPKSCWIGKLSI